MESGNFFFNKIAVFGRIAREEGAVTPFVNKKTKSGCSFQFSLNLERNPRNDLIQETLFFPK